MSESVYQAKQPVSSIAPSGVANRVAGTADGLLMLMQQAGSALLGPGAVTGRAASKVVAASNASAGLTASADYTCDGVADDVQINAALAAVAAIGGTVLLSEGTFTLAAPVVLNGVGQTLCGMGMGATTLFVVGSGGAAVNAGIVQMPQGYCVVSDLTINGNKANNAAQTLMTLVDISGITNPIVQRVRAVNSAGYGIVALATVANGVIRDCVVEGAVAGGFVGRALSGQPMVISGCVAKGNGGYGIACDNGPVVLSDCQALNTTTVSTLGAGFYVAGVTQTTLTNCLAQGNSTHGFRVSGSTALASFTACRAVGNTGYGFWTDGTQTQYLGCLASGTLLGSGFMNNTAARDVTYTGCVSLENSDVGYYSYGTRITYTGCRAASALSTSGYGWSIDGGSSVSMTGCSIYGNGATDYGLNIGSGARHVIHGCRIQHVGGSGMNISNTVTDSQITNNNISDVSLAEDGGYEHINCGGDRIHIAGNMLRDPAAGNRPWGGIYLSSAAADCFVGYNDTSGAGIDEEVSVSNVAIRRITQLSMNYNQAADVNAVVLAAGYTWYDFIANQTFRVNWLRNIVEIGAKGTIWVGNNGAGLSEVRSRLVIDGSIYRNYGGNTTEYVTGYQNALSGGQAARLTDLAVGNHTVKLQVWSTQTGYAYCNPAYYAPGTEFFNLQVTEYAR